MNMVPHLAAKPAFLGAIAMGAIPANQDVREEQMDVTESNPSVS